MRRSKWSTQSRFQPSHGSSGGQRPTYGSNTTPIRCFNCQYYVLGEPGSRRCKRNLWDERRPEMLPSLDGELMVLKPDNCWIRI